MRVAAMLVALCAAASAGSAWAQGLHALVDRLSARVDASLGGEADAERFRALDGAEPDPERSVVTGASFARRAEGPDEVDTLKLTVKMPGGGPRLLLID